MKFVFFLWIIFSISLFASDKEESFQDKNTGLKFASKVNAFTRTEVFDRKLYETIFVGYSKDDIKITCYIYPIQSRDLKEAFKTIKLGLYLAKERGIYQDVRFISQEEYKVKKALGLKGIFEIKIEKKQNRSLAYLFQFGEYLFKIRATYVVAKEDKIEKSIDDFVNKILEVRGKPKEKKKGPLSTLELMESFLEQPFKNEALMKRLLLFVVNSDKIEIKIDANTIPGIKGKSSYNGILLTAYIVGNAKAQLLKKVKKDMPQEGQKAMLKVYKIVKEYSFSFRNEELDKLLKK